MQSTPCRQSGWLSRPPPKCRKVTTPQRHTDSYWPEAVDCRWALSPPEISIVRAAAQALTRGISGLVSQCFLLSGPFRNRAAGICERFVNSEHLRAIQRRNILFSYAIRQRKFLHSLTRQNRPRASSTSSAGLRVAGLSLGYVQLPIVNKIRKNLRVFATGRNLLNIS